MKFDGSDLLMAILLFSLIGAVLGIAVGHWLGYGDNRREAVKAGVARYVAAEDGSSKFEWIVPPEKK